MPDDEPRPSALAILVWVAALAFSVLAWVAFFRLLA